MLHLPVLSMKCRHDVKEATAIVVESRHIMGPPLAQPPLAQRVMCRHIMGPPLAQQVMCRHDVKEATAIVRVQSHHIMGPPFAQRVVSQLARRPSISKLARCHKTRQTPIMRVAHTLHHDNHRHSYQLAPLLRIVTTIRELYYYEND